ncbi:MAG: biotin/lipoyl-containing protein, partial [Chloroflexota bacterium]
MAKVTMPQLGESVAEGTIGKWLKQPGDHVAKYEPLVEVVTDKVNAEVPSPFEGVLREILAEEGSVVPNNAEIAVIETSDDGAGSAAATAPAEPVAASEAPAPPTASATPTPNETPAAAPAQAPAPPVATGPAGSDERGPAEMSAAAHASPVAAP